MISFTEIKLLAWFPHWNNTSRSGSSANFLFQSTRAPGKSEAIKMPKSGDESYLSCARFVVWLAGNKTTPKNKESVENIYIRNRCYSNELSQLKLTWYALKNRNYSDPAQRAFLHRAHPTDSCLIVKAQNQKSERSRRYGWSE